MDRKWWYRIGFVLILVAFVVMLGRASLLAFKPEHSRIERAESGAMGKAAPPAGAPAPRDAAPGRNVSEDETAPQREAAPGRP
jgi:hypothetical protein